MPEDSKKSHDKKKSDPKEQRRPRQRHQQPAAEKKQEKKFEEHKNVSKVTVPQKPVYESPPPEFYKNLKRETDDILKITEEENAKYKKKEIQSNWSKYEMAIESYEEIEDQDNLGADYEKLVQAPLSIGGHFQFKHEKSWDLNTGPSLYDKYFEINMEDLNIALCTIPFYERNSIEETIFSPTDILTMTNRSTRFKQKYYNDKSYSTPETEAQDKILSNLRDSMKNDSSEKDKESNIDIQIKCDNNENEPELVNSLEIDINLVVKPQTKTDPAHNVDNKIIEDKVFKHDALIENIKSICNADIDEVVDNNDNASFGCGDNIKPKVETVVSKVERPSAKEKPEKSLAIDTKVSAMVGAKVTATTTSVAPTALPQAIAADSKDADTIEETEKNTVIESPEDLEKWLDEFLDG